MTTYKNNMRRSSEGAGALSDRELLGDLYDIYYNNKDFSILLNLLASGSGVAESLVLMTVLDQRFKENLKPEIEFVTRNKEDGTAQIKLKVRVVI